MGVEEFFKLANARVRGPASFLPDANDVKARVGSARVDAAKRHRRFITAINHRRYLLTGVPELIASAQGDSDVPLDVALSDPTSEFSDLYRLVDAYAVCDVRVTMPAAPGLLKAIKLAAALRLSGPRVTRSTQQGRNLLQTYIDVYCAISL